jgi:hypothetical protein
MKKIEKYVDHDSWSIGLIISNGHVNTSASFSPILLMHDHKHLAAETGVAEVSAGKFIW